MPPRATTAPHAETHGDARSDAPAEHVCRMTWVRRGLGLVGLVGLLSLLGFEIAEAGTLWTGGVLTDLAMSGGVALGAAHQLGTSIHVSDDALWKATPLWEDRTVRFDEVRRLHVPMVRVDSGVRLYTDPDGTPALTLEAQTYERFDDLLRQVARRLPEDAEVKDPAGRLVGQGGADEEGP